MTTMYRRGGALRAAGEDRWHPAKLSGGSSDAGGNQEELENGIAKELDFYEIGAGFGRRRLDACRLCQHADPQ
jgi:hypothetical protein